MESNHSLIDSVLSVLNGYFYRCEAGESYDVIDITDGVERITGHPRHSIMDGRVKTWDVVHPEDRERIDERTQKAVAANLPWENYFRMIRKSGEIVHVYEIGKAILDVSGSPVWYEGMIIDASEMRLQRDAATDIDHFLASMISEASKVTQLMKTLRLLAFNARIESARIGRQGNGFAAVASEMKDLARHGDALIHAISAKRDELLARIQAA